MEISSKEDYNIDSAFLQMIQEVHMKNIQEIQKITNFSNTNNYNSSIFKKSNYSENKSKCCG